MKIKLKVNYDLAGRSLRSFVSDFLRIPQHQFRNELQRKHFVQMRYNRLLDRNVRPQFETSKGREWQQDIITGFQKLLIESVLSDNTTYRDDLQYEPDVLVGEGMRKSESVNLKQLKVRRSKRTHTFPFLFVKARIFNWLTALGYSSHAAYMHTINFDQFCFPEPRRTGLRHLNTLTTLQQYAFSPDELENQASLTLETVFDTYSHVNTVLTKEFNHARRVRHGEVFALKRINSKYLLHRVAPDSIHFSLTDLETLRQYSLLDWLSVLRGKSKKELMLDMIEEYQWMLLGHAHYDHLFRWLQLQRPGYKPPFQTIRVFKQNDIIAHDDVSEKD